MLLAPIYLSLLLWAEGQEILKGLSDYALNVDPLSGTSSHGTLKLVKQLFSLRVSLGCEASYVPILSCLTRVTHGLVLLWNILLVAGVMGIILLHLYLLLLLLLLLLNSVWVVVLIWMRVSDGWENIISVTIRWWTILVTVTALWSLLLSRLDLLMSTVQVPILLCHCTAWWVIIALNLRWSKDGLVPLHHIGHVVIFIH